MEIGIYEKIQELFRMPLQLLTLMMSEPVLVSLTPDGNICTERTYYAMICEIDAAACKVTFHVTDDVA